MRSAKIGLTSRKARLRSSSLKAACTGWSRACRWIIGRALRRRSTEHKSGSLLRRGLRRPVTELSQNLLIMLAERGRRRLDARAAMREFERREWDAESARDAGRACVLVDEATRREMRVRDGFAHRAHTARRHMARLQEVLPLVRSARQHDFGEYLHLAVVIRV